MKFIIRSVFVLFPALFISGRLCAQDTNTIPIEQLPIKAPRQKKDTLFHDTVTKQRDLFEVIGSLSGKKPSAKSDSITSKPSVTVLPALGYTLVSRFAVGLSGNAVFKTGPASRISTVIANTSYTQNKQFTLPVQTNIWTKDNNFNFIGDYRFYKYPQSTFGLGSNSNFKDEDPMVYSYFQFYETALRHITGNLYMGLGYILDNHWNVSEKGNLDGGVSDYARYGKSTHSIASGLTFNILFDSRDNAINSSKGTFLSLQYRDNYSFLGSNTAYRSLILDLRRYYRFPEGSHNILALWSYDWLILNGTPAYLDLPSTQWDANSATGRGYIQGRFRGAQMIYGEAEYRYRLTNDGLLGGVVFLNLESFSASPGTRLQAVQPGYGPGVRVKINKLSNTNVTIDYGFGREGSKGLFIDIGEAF